MQALSLQAIFLFHGVFLFSTGLLIAWLFRRAPDLSARLWVTASLISALATGLTAFRPVLPLWPGYLLPVGMEFSNGLLHGVALMALIKPVPRLRSLLLGIATVCVAYVGLILLVMTQVPSARVPVGSLLLGLTHVLPAIYVWRRCRGNREFWYVQRLCEIQSALGMLWLTRLAVHALGGSQHALDVQLSNWLIFAAMMGGNIVLQFAYIGLRFANAYENRMALAQLQSRLELLQKERDGLLLRRRAPSGALTNQIAHEINQPLAAIRLTLDEMARHTHGNGAGAELSLVLADLDRISQSLHNARQLTQAPPPDLQTLSASALVDLVTAQLRYPVPFEVHGPERLLRLDPTVMAVALKTLLEPGPLQPAPVLSLLMSAPSNGFARLRIVMQSDALSPEEMHALNGGDFQRLGPGRVADRVLDLLTVSHQVRAQSGRLHVCLVTSSEPIRLHLDLYVPAVAAETAKPSLSPSLAAT